MAKTKRVRIFVTNEPGPDRRWLTWVYFPDGSNFPSTDLTTKKVALAEAKALAKLHQPASVWEQRRDSKTGRYLFAEVFSFPSKIDRPGDER